MVADSQILNLSKVSLEIKDLLPEYSGIYYVLDENNTVWYIGKAQNIRKRWQGNSHHRIYQLKKQKQKYFSIYYEQVDIAQLDRREQQQIEKYYPHLNNSPAKNKKVRPTETLLRETIAKISDFAFILGVEPPRREVKDKISIDWLVEEKILDLEIIHICLDMNAFKEQFNIDSVNEYEALRVKPFKTRKVYASKWKCLPKVYPLIFRLNVNGYVVEVSDLNFWIEDKNIERIRQYNQATIANQLIRALIPESLNTLQNYYYKHQTRRLILKRLNPYRSDLISLLFDELVDLETERQKLSEFSNDYKIGKRGIGSRCHPIKSKPINSDFTTMDELLISRGINPNKYDGNNLIQRSNKKRINLYIKCFHLDPNIIYSYGKSVDGSQVPSYNSVVGILNNKKNTCASYNFDTIYLLASVEIKAWLLVEDYLNDFATALKKFKNKEGVTNKFYISPRKYSGLHN